MDTLLLENEKRAKIVKVDSPSPDKLAEYQKTYFSLFGKIDEYHSPKNWFEAYIDEELFGVLSYTEFNKSTVYIQFCGVNPQFRGGWNDEIFYEVMNQIRDEYRYTTAICVVERTNIRAIKKVLNVGFLISGVRNLPPYQRTPEPFWVEFVRPL